MGMLDLFSRASSGLRLCHLLATFAEGIGSAHNSANADHCRWNRTQCYGAQAWESLRLHLGEADLLKGNAGQV